MDAALIASALLMGLAGSLHCTVMCGAASGAIARQGGQARFSEALLAWHAGRLVSYAAAGAVVAAGVAGLVSLQGAAPLLRPVWTLVHVGAIALGFWLAWTARAPGWLSGASPRVAALAELQPIRVLRKLPASGRAGMAGACWAAMPCGLLQSALLVAALASGAAAGAAVMAVFATASGLGLWLGPQLWSRLRRGSRDADAAAVAWSVRGAGALLAGSSLFALWHGLGSAIEQALCRVTG
ncbi:MAG: urease accessory protein UreH domain-containing protein [Caldimonas sp.]